MRALKSLVSIVAALLFFTGHSSAATHSIEPDNYAEGAVLNDVHPLVELRIYDGVLRDDFPNDFGMFPDPDVIPVTANENDDIFGGYFTSTGTKSFGHANIAFFPESRQLAMRFLAPTTDVSVDFIGTSTLAEQVGVLEIFNAQGDLLDTFTSGPLLTHKIATLSLSRAAGDIGYARAFSSHDASPFGALDNLRFTTIPEPAAGILAMVAAMLIAVLPGGRRQRQIGRGEI